jgi:hypothetical protein
MDFDQCSFYGSSGHFLSWYAEMYPTIVPGRTDYLFRKEFAPPPFKLAYPALVSSLCLEVLLRTTVHRRAIDRPPIHLLQMSEMAAIV